MAYFSPAELQAMTQAGVTPPAITAEMMSYCRLHYALIFAGIAYSVLTLLGLLYSGAAGALSKFCRRVTSRKWLQIPLFYLLLTLIIMLIRMPFSWYAGYYVDHSYGLSHQSIGSWLGDLLKGKAVDGFVNALGITIAFLVIDKFPRRWPVILWACLLPLVAAGIFLAPLLIDPLFNKFTVMAPSPSESRIRAIATKAGIADAPIFIVNKSKQTTKLNAYVTGLGSSTRIVIWDNTLEKLPIDQVEAIVAHESGHYVLGHILLGFTMIAVGLIALFVGVAKFGNSVIMRLPKRWDVHSLTDLTAIPVIMLFATVGAFLFAPIDNAISRAMEHQADEFGLQITQNPPAMARTFVSLSQQNLSEPQPPAFIEFWLFSHPSLRDRILFALRR
jgi:STE24 endopeptidase